MSDDVLSLTQQQDYERDGYLLVKQSFAAAECEVLSKEADRLATWHEVIRPDNLRTETWRFDEGHVVNKYDPVVDVAPVFADVAADARLTHVVAALFGEPPLLFKDKLIFKMPGHEGFGPHQDQTWYRCFPSNLIAAMISIDAADAVNGALEVAPGCHRTGNPVPQTEVRDLTASECPPETTWRMVATETGDVVFFDNLLPHRSGPNISDRPRRTLYLTYNPGRYGDLHGRYYAHRRALMLQSNGVSRGNFYVAPEYRDTADYYPAIPSLRLFDLDQGVVRPQPGRDGGARHLPAVRGPARTMAAGRGGTARGALP